MKQKRISLENILSGLKKRTDNCEKNTKKYTIILKDNKDKNSFIEDMESSSTLNLETIPKRSCVCLNKTNNNRRVLQYNLTKEESDMLRTDSRVSCVEEYVDSKIQKMGFNNTEKLLKPYGSSTPDPKKKEFKIQSFDQYAKILNLPNGSDVDVLIVDGFMSPSNPEFDLNKNGTGGSRVNQINWYEIINYTNPSYPSYPYISYVSEDPIINENNNHGTHVAGITCGNTQGWAPNSNIFNMYPYASLFPDEETLKDLYLYAIKTWHENKNINTSYGNKNPTITNHSYGMYYGGLWDTRNILSINYRGTTITPQRNYSGAELQAILNESGGVGQINIVNQGLNYTNEPTISFYGGGQAEGVAELAENSVKTIVITDGGSGYDPLNPPTVTFSAPPAGGIRAMGTIVSQKILENGDPKVYVDVGNYQVGPPGNGQIYNIELTEAGSGYLEPPTITFSNPAPGGRVAQAYTTIGSNFIKKINITNGGTGYMNDVSVPAVILSGGNPSQSADISFGPIAYEGDYNFVDSNGSLLNGIYEPYLNVFQEFFGAPVSIYSDGGFYESQPILSFYGGNTWEEDGSITGTKPHVRVLMGSGADANKIVGVNIVKNGEGYTSPPNIVISNGGGFTVDQLKSYGIVVYNDNYPEYLNRPIVANIPFRDAAIDSDVEDLISSGAIVVAAAGNDYYKIDTPLGLDYNNYMTVIDYPRIKAESSILGPTEGTVTVRYNRGSSPGSCPGVICVGAAEAASTEYKTEWSSTGPRVDIYAPGEYINSSTYTEGVPDPRNSDFCLAKWSGTSMASPQVAGMLTCYAQNNRGLNQADAYNFIINNSKNTIQEGSDYRSLQGGSNKYVYYPGISYE